MRAGQSVLLSVTVAIAVFLGYGARKGEISFALVSQFYPNPLNTTPLNSTPPVIINPLNSTPPVTIDPLNSTPPVTIDPLNSTPPVIIEDKPAPNIPPSIRLLLAERAKRPRRLPSFQGPPTVEDSPSAETEPGEPQSSGEAASRLWDQPVLLLNVQTFLFISVVANVLFLYYNIGHGWIKKFYSAMCDKSAAAPTAVTGRYMRKNIEESWQPPHLVKHHQPQQGVKNLHPVKKCATNQNMIQHGNVTTDRPTTRPGVVSRKSAPSTTEKPRSTVVPVGSKQKGSSLAVTQSAGVKKGVFFPDIRKAMTKLESTEWDIVMGGMQDISEILRCKPALVEERLAAIYSFLSSAVLHDKSKLARAACLMAKEIFETVQCTTKAGYHDLLSSLLTRTTRYNKFFSQEAAEALDAMVLNTPPHYAVKAVVNYGLRHNNSLVRARASRLLTLVITTSGADKVLGPKAPRIFKHQVISSAASFLEDGNTDARHHAQDLFKFLMAEYEDCEFVFKEEIEENVWKRISKKLVSMRAEINKRSQHSSRK